MTLGVDNRCGLCHDMPNRPCQAAVEIDATQLPRIAELLDLLDGFLRHTDGIATIWPTTCTPPAATTPIRHMGPPTTPTCSR